jgi:hypothetical protein
VLDGGLFFLAEHQQNIPPLNLGDEVWGVAWNAKFSTFVCGTGLLHSRSLDLLVPVLNDLNVRSLRTATTDIFVNPASRLASLQPTTAFRTQEVDRFCH